MSTKLNFLHSFRANSLLKKWTTTSPRRQPRCFLTSNAKDEYEPVPHYKQMSALYIKASSPSATKIENIFPKIISPELNLDDLFKFNMEESLLNLNLSSRYIHLNLDRLRRDFLQMRSLEIQMDELNRQKSQLTDKISRLVKSATSGEQKKLILNSPEALELLKQANELKAKANVIMEDFLPLAEIVNVACLRLPNSLHFSTLFLDSIISSYSNEERYRHILFDLNSEYRDLIKDKNKLLSSQAPANWENILDDSIIIDSKVIKSKYAVRDRELKERWSFVRESSVDSLLNNRYLVGTYANLEQSLVFYVHDRLNKLNSFEHFKSVSLFKSAIIEGCGENFNDTRRIFNVVRFNNLTGESISNDARSPSSTHVELFHLTGACSLNALVLNFVRTKISANDMPWTVYTNGKSYSPDFGQVNGVDLLTLCADTSEFILINSKLISDLNVILNEGRAYLDRIKNELNAYAQAKLSADENRRQLIHTDKTIDEIFISYLKLFVHVYREFNLPIRFVCLHANHLKPSDSFKVQVQAYLPSELDYVTVCIWVLILGRFIIISFFI
jgi:hypothetical protein